MNKLLVILIISIIIAPIVYSSPLQIILRPKINNNLQPSTAFNYTFNFTKDNSCTNILYSNTTELTTDSQGIGFIELELPKLNKVPDYLCEYRNNVLRKVHKIGIILGSMSLISNSTIGNNLDVTGSINATSFVGNGSLITGISSISILDNSIISSKIASDSVNNSHVLDDTLTDLDINDLTNITLGQKITFALGSIIDNIINSWIRITGSLSISGNVSVGNEINISGISSDGSGNIVCINSDGSLGTCSDDIKKVNGKANCLCG